MSSGRIDAPWFVDVAILLGAVLVWATDARLGLAIWLVATMLVASRWPASGVGIAGACAVFPQPVHFGMTASVAILAASGVGTAIDHVWHRRSIVADDRWRGLVVAGTVAVVAATGLAVIHTLYRFAPPVAVASVLRWTGVVAGLAVLVLGMRASSLGSRRVLLLALSGLIAALTIALIDLVFPRLIPSIGLGGLLSQSESSRAAGPFASPNRLGTVAAIAAIVGATVVAAGPRRHRWVWGALATLGIAALAVSFSRGALLGLAVAGALLAFSRSRRTGVVYLGVVVVLALIAVPLLVSTRLAVSGGSLGELEGNDAGRVEAWLAGIRMIAAEPIFGQGFNAFAVLGPSYGATDGLATAHNEVIDLWSSSGIAAAGGYLAIVVGCVALGLRDRRDPWRLVAAAAVLVFFVASSFNVQTPFLAVTAPLWGVVSYGVARPPTATDEDPNP
jgi:O-antigen ligase